LLVFVLWLGCLRAALRQALNSDTTYFHKCVYLFSLSLLCDVYGGLRIYTFATVAISTFRRLSLLLTSHEMQGSVAAFDSLTLLALIISSPHLPGNRVACLQNQQSRPFGVWDGVCFRSHGWYDLAVDLKYV
jgi:hypothetical protein